MTRPMPPRLVDSSDVIGGLMDSLVHRMQHGTALDPAALLPQRSMGRSALLQFSSHPKPTQRQTKQKIQSVAIWSTTRNTAPAGHPSESAIRVHPNEEGWFMAAAKTICTPAWMRHSLHGRILCLSDETQARLVDQLDDCWPDDSPAAGKSPGVAVVTVKQLRDGIPLTRDSAIQAPEMLPCGGVPTRAFREVFIAKDLSESGDCRAILEAIASARVGLHWVRHSQE